MSLLEFDEVKTLKAENERELPFKIHYLIIINKLFIHSRQFL
jgi:hypothetical protein